MAKKKTKKVEWKRINLALDPEDWGLLQKAFKSNNKKIHLGTFAKFLLMEKVADNLLIDWKNRIGA